MGGAKKAWPRSCRIPAGVRRWGTRVREAGSPLPRASHPAQLHRRPPAPHPGPQPPGGAGLAGLRGAPAPGRGGAPLGLLTRGAAGRPPSSAPASRLAPAPAPARAASRGRRRCLSDVLAAAAPRCRLGVVVSGSAASKSVPVPQPPEPDRRFGPKWGLRGAEGILWVDKPGLGPSLKRGGPDAWRRRGGKGQALLTVPLRAAAQGGVDGD
uniref:Uncharacterized protein n=1 Tax=Rangifer tarandus platyrhynchus TaxID=3082113 RepID=A0ACB0EAL5_RANTA|nr:unnamed protein product [Rangifer tarandus platyrhynchus]